MHVSFFNKSQMRGFVYLQDVARSHSITMAINKYLIFTFLDILQGLIIRMRRSLTCRQVRMRSVTPWSWLLLVDGLTFWACSPVIQSPGQREPVAVFVDVGSGCRCCFWIDRKPPQSSVWEDRTTGETWCECRHRQDSE